MLGLPQQEVPLSSMPHKDGSACLYDLEVWEGELLLEEPEEEDRSRTEVGGGSKVMTGRKVRTVPRKFFQDTHPHK